MIKKKLLKKAGALAMIGAFAFSSLTGFAATTNGALEGSSGTNGTSVTGDLKDSDIIDADKKGSLTIYKYDFTSADEDGITFNYSDTDHDSDGTESTLTTKDGKTVTITSTGEKNADAESALAEYAIQGVEFTYLRVGDVLTLSDVNEDGVNGDIELIYGIDTDLMKILGLKAYSKSTAGTGYVAVTQVSGTNYFTSQQIIDALKEALASTNYSGTYATNEGEGTGSSTSSGTRLDGQAGITVTDALEDYIKEHNGTAMTKTDANGVTTTGEDALDLGLYLIVETAVPENVTSTTSPWFVQVPMTDIDGEEWFYDIFCYPKNNTGHPTLDKLVRNAYGTAGLNYDSDGSATYTSGNKVDTGDEYSSSSEIVTNGDTLSGTDYASWLSDSDKNGDYEYASTVTASEGDILDYILVTKLPHISSKATYLTNYELVDTLSDGLKYNEDLKIAIYNVEEYAKVNDTTHAIDVWTLGDGTYDPKFTTTNSYKSDGSTYIDITMTEEGLNEINTKYYDGNHYLVAYYTATLTSDATTVLGDTGNPNDVTLIWQRTSEGYYNTLEDECIVYSYGLDLTKTFSDGNTKEADFKSVKFVLYNETEDYYVVAEQSSTDGLYYVTGKVTDKAKATVFSPSAEGYLVINGLEADEYKLTEIETAEGYSLLQNQIDIVITPSSREITASSVTYMTVDSTDHNIEHPTSDQKITLSNGQTITAKEEGTTDKDNMVIGDLTEATATVDGVSASMTTYGGTTIGKSLITATANGSTAVSSENADVVLSVMNSKGFTLPQTGGAGLYLICILGVVVVVAGCYSFRRKKNVA